MLKLSNKINRAGFTLVELLVVVSIVAILTAVIMSNVRTAKEKARDSVRMQDVKTFQAGLALYQTGKGQYPIYDGYITGDDLLSQSLKNDMILKSIPLDPINRITGSIDYRYYYKSVDGSIYLIKFCLETTSIQSYNKGCDNEVKP